MPVVNGEEPGPPGARFAILESAFRPEARVLPSAGPPPAARATVYAGTRLRREAASPHSQPSMAGTRRSPSALQTHGQPDLSAANTEKLEPGQTPVLSSGALRGRRSGPVRRGLYSPTVGRSELPGGNLVTDGADFAGEFGHFLLG